MSFDAPDTNSRVAFAMISHDRKFFYKYTSASTALKILENETVRWSSPNQFNDPFDIQFNLRVPFSKDEYREAMTNQLQDVFENGRTHPIEANNGSTMLFNQLLDLMRNANQNFGPNDFITQMLPSLDQSYEAMLNGLPDNHQGIRQVLDDICVFCVSEVPDSLLMWSHYAASHQGAVIKFRCLPKFDTALCAAVPVNYTDDIPPFATLEGVVESAFGLAPLRGDHLFRVLTATKSTAWSYEREWRTVATFRNGEQRTLGYADYEIHKEEIQEVVLGCRMSGEDREQIQKVLRDKYPHTILREAQKHSSKYGLEFVDIS